MSGKPDAEPPALIRGFLFDAEGRAQLASLAGWIGYAAYVSFAVAAIALLGVVIEGAGIDDGLMPSIFRLGTAFVNALIGLAFIRARSEFRRASLRPGDEHESLLKGLRKLDSYYAIHRWFLKLGLIFFAIGIGLGLVAVLVRLIAAA